MQQTYDGYTQQLTSLYEELNKNTFEVSLVNGQKKVPFSTVVRAYQPNSMSIISKLGFYVEKFWEFLSDDPREANTEGGIFPLFFGTVLLLVIIMSILVTPFGVIAAVYLREWRSGMLQISAYCCKQSCFGVPSVVYGVFGLGFFVYFLGGSIDQLFFKESLPTPTFGTPGLLWASLTLAIITVPVVIVATEEGFVTSPPCHT